MHEFHSLGIFNMCDCNKIFFISVLHVFDTTFLQENIPFEGNGVIHNFMITFNDIY